MNDEDYEHAMDAAWAAREADYRMWRRGAQVADIVEPLMPWLGIDDGFWAHPKIVGLSDKAFRLHVVALSWCAQNLTDGAVDNSQAKVLSRLIQHRFTARSNVFRELTESGLWTVSDDGYRIHDYLEYNPDAASVKAQREADAARQRNSRAIRHGVTPAVTDLDVTPSRPGPLKERLIEERKRPKTVTPFVPYVDNRPIDPHVGSEMFPNGQPCMICGKLSKHALCPDHLEEHEEE